MSFSTPMTVQFRPVHKPLFQGGGSDGPEQNEISPLVPEKLLLAPRKDNLKQGREQANEQLIEVSEGLAIPENGPMIADRLEEKTGRGFHAYTNEAMLRIALHLREASLPPNHPDIVKSWYNLGKLLANETFLNRDAKPVAVDYLTRALAKIDPAGEQAADIHFQIGGVLLAPYHEVAPADHTRIENHLTQSLSLLTAIHKSEYHPNLKPVYEDLAGFYKHVSKNKAKAVEMETKEALIECYQTRNKIFDAHVANQKRINALEAKLKSAVQGN